MNNSKEFEELMENLRIHGLEKQTLEQLKNSHWGRIYAIIYFLIGIASIFIYSFVFKFSIIFSIILGIVTWFILSFIVDKILIKTRRIDKQLNWLLKTPEGIAELRKRGMTDEQIEELKLDLENNPLYKEFTLEDKTGKGKK